MARQPPCREGLGHGDGEGLELARRQGRFEVVRSFQLAQACLILISQAVAALTKTSGPAARMAVRASG